MSSPQETAYRYTSEMEPYVPGTGQYPSEEIIKQRAQEKAEQIAKVFQAMAQIDPRAGRVS